MWKVTPVAMQNACCAGAQLVANTNKLAARGNPVPATAPRQYVCACANTRSLFNSLRWFILATDQIATCRSLQPGICKGGRGKSMGVDGTAVPLPAQERGNQHRRRRAGLAPRRFGRALQRPQTVRKERPPSSRRGTYVTSVGAVVCRLWLQADRDGNGLGFFAGVAVCAGEHPRALNSHRRKPALQGGL